MPVFSLENFLKRTKNTTQGSEVHVQDPWQAAGHCIPDRGIYG